MAKTAKSKSGRSRSTGHSTHPRVISFRLTSAHGKAVDKIIEQEPATNINSGNQLCRKIVVDYLAGRLAYKNPRDKESDLESVS